MLEGEHRVVDLAAAPGLTAIYSPAGQVAGVIPTKAYLRATNVQGVTGQPEISFQRTAPNDVMPSLALNLTADDQVKSLFMGDPSLYVPQGDTLSLSLDLAAVATAYEVELVVIGRALPL